MFYFPQVSVYDKFQFKKAEKQVIHCRVFEKHWTGVPGNQKCPGSLERYQKVEGQTII